MCLRRFGNVIQADATYKTNKCWMPLVNIVGVDNSNRTFVIAMAWISSECIDNYKWVLHFLVQMAYEDDTEKIKSILTDKDPALMEEPPSAEAYPHCCCEARVSFKLPCRHLLPAY